MARRCSSLRLGSSFFPSRLCCHRLTGDVEEDGADDDEAQDHVLDRGVNGQKGKTVAQGRNDHLTTKHLMTQRGVGNQYL